mgnify:CR=1 FL=1
MDISKQDLIDELKSIINKKIKELKHSIKKTEESRDLETKSSVGDKYETSRALIQIELGQYQKQLKGHLAKIQSLNEINPNKKMDVVETGALVETDTANYFISIGFGEFLIKGKKIFVISLNSPIGEKMAGAKVNDKIEFNGITQTLQKVS